MPPFKLQTEFFPSNLTDGQTFTIPVKGGRLLEVSVQEVEIKGAYQFILTIRGKASNTIELPPELQVWIDKKVQHTSGTIGTITQIRNDGYNPAAIIKWSNGDKSGWIALSECKLVLPPEIQANIGKIAISINNKLVGTIQEITMDDNGDYIATIIWESPLSQANNKIPLDKLIVNEI